VLKNARRNQSIGCRFNRFSIAFVLDCIFSEQCRQQFFIGQRSIGGNRFATQPLRLLDGQFEFLCCRFQAI
jgi:hypothetical protein